MKKSGQASAATVYQDEEGNAYKVMPGIGGNAFKARKRKPGSPSWKCMRQLEWRGSFERAQADLDGFAQRNGRTPATDEGCGE